jgi:hypothetical protein
LSKGSCLSAVCFPPPVLQLSKELRSTEKGLFNLLFGIFGFPFGLTITVLNGASLFTSNVAYMMAAFIERKSSAWGALRIVALSWVTNFMGEWGPLNQGLGGCMAECCLHDLRGGGRVTLNNASGRGGGELLHGWWSISCRVGRSVDAFEESE